MTRQANPKNGKWFNANANNPEEETIISNFKSYAVHLNVDCRDLFFEWIEKELKLANWPVNAQTRLAAYQHGESVTVESCKCGKHAIVSAVDLRSKNRDEYKFCKECFSKVPMRYDAKVWKIRQIIPCKEKH